MVPENVLTRVFNLRMGSQTATGFTIEVDNRQYLVTARHVINASPAATEIELFHDAGWMKVPFRPITIEPTMVDIAVLALDRQVSDVLPVKNGARQDYFLSPEVFFGGYPCRIVGGLLSQIRHRPA
jgi:S1-C subfamily serine protease